MYLLRFVCTNLFLLLLVLALHLSLCCCDAIANSLHRLHCDKPASCGQILNISYPLGLKGHPLRNCTPPLYPLLCENNRTVFHSKHGVKYYVLAINYNNSTIRVVDAGLQKDNCSSLPIPSFSPHNDYGRFSYLENQTKLVLFLSCENRVGSDSSVYIETSPCVGGVHSQSPVERGYYSYVMRGNAAVGDIADSCRVDMAVSSSSATIYRENLSYADIHNELLYGFELRYMTISDLEGSIKQFIKVFLHVFGPILGLVAALLIAIIMCLRCCCVLPFVAALFIRKFRRRHLSTFVMVEAFLQNQNNLMPISYSFSQIKKMTKGFKNKLGEGGYGSVYKGKLRSGRDVAIKILDKSKCSGQEFINEVMTIGRIHHVNVVRLIGFCAGRSKHALVYDFMSNGSLEKYLFSEGSNNSLSCKKMYEIAVGVARGIEYLHKGCDMQILHFDIKPHNILLDENFIPKVSDFGLAKIYPIEKSIVSLTAARGTMGYMAPELFYKNIGGISYKADIYSFGMLLMEMAGKRKNLNANVEQLSQIYFPSWVFEQLSLGKEIEIGEMTDEEKELVKKMMMVSLWSIQTKPSDRPSISRVVEMLKSEIEGLEMPPKPFLSLREMSKVGGTAQMRPSESQLPDPPSDEASSTVSELRH